MCINMNAMDSVVDQCGNTDLPEPESNWIEKCIETENIFLDYLKSLTLISFNVETPVENILLEYDGSKSGLEAIDNLYDLLVTLYETNTSRNEPFEDMQELNKNKRTLKCLSPHYGKELQVKPNRARSHSSVGVDEILRTQELIDLNPSESRRKSRRVSLGMRPRFSNWSKMKGAFKRDKSNTRIDSREDYPDTSCSGDESTEKFSSSHENVNQLSSDEDEEFEYYTEGIPLEVVNDRVRDITEYKHTIPKSKSAIIQIHKPSNPSNTNHSSHKNPFKWYRTKSGNVSTTENDGDETLSMPPSPNKNAHFLYDEDSINKFNHDYSGNSLNEVQPTPPSDILLDIQNKYESLQKKLSREFYEKYHDWRRAKDAAANYEDVEKCSVPVDDLKLSPIMVDQSLSPRFKQKFQEWQKIKSLSLSPTRFKTKPDNFNPLKKSKSDWHKWKSGKSESNVLKLIDKEEGGSTYDSEDVTSSLQYNKKQIQPGEKKELIWLEKELQKVAREKQRLEKEKEKYAERETRLRNMKRAIKSGRTSKQEVLVPTSIGLFRFQGISSKFTKKLYEWEKAKGIAAESSTFALLDSYLEETDASNKLQNLDQTALLSRSRSVGSVEVAGVGSSLLNSNSMSHQQSSLSLNDMEQLEGAHLQVENENLMQSASELFDKENENEYDLISNKSLIIPDYSKSSTSHSIPLLSSSIECSLEKQSNLNKLRSSIYSKQSNESGDISGSCGSGSHIVFHPLQSDTDFEVSSKLEQRESVNADARSIVDEIEKLRAKTSIDDEDRINILTSLQNLADQLVDMVHNLNTKKNENTDELAVHIADLALTLKKKIKRLATDELQSTFSKESISTDHDKNEIFPNEDFTYNGEEVKDVYTDTEDNESPTVHCTFTLPSWRLKYTTPSSTESESSHSKNKYADTRQNKNDKQKQHFSNDHSSGNDENYDGSDETTLYLDLKSVKSKPRRESAGNIRNNNNSKSLFHSEKEKLGHRKNVKIPESEDQEVLHCTLSLDGVGKKELMEKKSNSNKSSQLKRISDCEKEPSFEQDHEAFPQKLDTRSYSPKPLSSKRKCSSCGKTKRISKSRKSTSSNYCCCRKENIKIEKPADTSSHSNLNYLSPSLSTEETISKSASYSTEKALNTRTKMGKISRSKIYDFNALKKSDEPITEPDLYNVDKSTINVIVPTTRKIFAPLSQNENGSASSVVSFTIDESAPKEKEQEEEGDDRGEGGERGGENEKLKSSFSPWASNPISKSVSPSIDSRTIFPTKLSAHPSGKSKFSVLKLGLHENTDKLPPASPLSIKRAFNKDNNSSIKMMIAHYNKLITENPDKKPLENSCWMSSVQKSPVMERRHKFENMNKNYNNGIRKCKSAVLTKKKSDSNNDQEKSDNSHFSIAKSSSVGCMRYSPTLVKFEDLEAAEVFGSFSTLSNYSKEPSKNESIKVEVENANISNISIFEKMNAPLPSLLSPAALERNKSFDSILCEAKLRTLKLKEAKNNFFNDFPNSNNYKENVMKVVVDLATTPTSEPGTIETNTNNQCNDVENNFNLSLNKSVSTGEIDERRKIRNVPIAEKAGSKSKFGFSSIASKFRKVKMRRHKDPEVSAVSSLCRASLLMNVYKEGRQKERRHSSKSCPSSPVMQRNLSKRNSSSN